MDTETRARERAYLLWEAAGCPEGRADEFWFAAEAEIAAEAITQSAPTAEVAALPITSARHTAVKRSANAATKNLRPIKAPVPEVADMMA